MPNYQIRSDEYGNAHIRHADAPVEGGRTRVEGAFYVTAPEEMILRHAKVRQKLIELFRHFLRGKPLDSVKVHTTAIALQSFVEKMFVAAQSPIVVENGRPDGLVLMELPDDGKTGWRDPFPAMEGELPLDY